MKFGCDSEDTGGLDIWIYFGEETMEGYIKTPPHVE